MIQKVKQPYVNKLRILQLYEADFNTTMKLMRGKRLMGHSEKHGLNGNQLYGSRKGKSTYEALITVRVIHDMARTQRNYLVSIFNDLKGCYEAGPEYSGNSENWFTTANGYMPCQNTPGYEASHTD